MTYNNNKTKKLTEFQQRKIKKMLSLNFFEELNKLTEKKKRFFKVFSDQIEILVKNFDEKGIMFYGLEIELPFFKEESWQKIHNDVEEFINYIGCHVELIEFCYFSIELKGEKPIWEGGKLNLDDEKIVPVIKGVIGVRSILGKNKALFLQIKNIFIISFFDVKVKWLSKSCEIIKYWSLIISQKNFKFHRFVNYSNFYPMIYGSIADEELKYDGRLAFGQENHFISDTMNVSGIMKKFPKKKELILYFIDLFLFEKNFKVCNNKIFFKKTKFKVSWEFFCHLDDLKDNFMLILDSIKLMYPQQLGDFDSLKLMLSKDLDFIFSKLKNDNSLLNNNIKEFDNVVEFKDGIFFFESKKFLDFNQKINFNEIRTIFFIDCVYSDLNSADFWLNFLYKKLDYDSFRTLMK